jgi:anhydro-N-acetylmuramic acid kinase
MQSSYLALGIMSGTSLDGVDLALCKFDFKGNFRIFKIVSAATRPYPAALLKKLKECVNYDQETIDKLDSELGIFFAELVKKFLSGKKVKPHIIASHGHTVFHRPDKGITLQIGNGRILAEQTGIKVVNDFRSEDVGLGGQGAPLVPIGDRDLFYAYDACLNLGGFANISFTDLKTEKRIACDISPCNLALNHLSQKLGQPYDSMGLLARGGEVDSSLFAQLNSLAYYSRQAPKSLGKEWFVDSFLPLIDSSELNIFDILASATQHIAYQISDFINDNLKPKSKILVTGGGTYHSFLIEKIENYCGAKLFIPAKKIIEYKEALIFAYLGVLKIRGEINVLSSVTGANKDSSSGVIHNPK